MPFTSPAIDKAILELQSSKRRFDEAMAEAADCPAAQKIIDANPETPMEGDLAGARILFEGFRDPRKMKRMAAKSIIDARKCRAALKLSGANPAAGVAAWLDRAARLRRQAIELKKAEDEALRKAAYVNRLQHDLAPIAAE